MSRINTNVSSLVARRVLTSQNDMLNSTLHRLSTGYRINNGKDDPAGLIASENLRTEQAAIGAAITNVARANNIVSVAEGALIEVNKLLLELEDLVDRSANTAGISDDERNANQLQIDAILDSINRIANSTEFQGKKILSGTFAYNTSGVSTGSIAGVVINAAKLPTDGYRAVVVEVTASAQVARLNYSGSTVGTSSVTIEVAGNLGTETLSFAASSNVSAVAFAINQSRDLTGVTASSNGSTLNFFSTKYGSSQFVSVRTLAGTFAVTGGDAGSNKDFGRDASVRINGTAATTDGLKASVRNSSLSVDIDLSSAFGTATGATTFYVVSGGADFMISPRVSLAGLESIGVQNIAASSLGDGIDGYISSLATGQSNALNRENYAQAQRVVRSAQTVIAKLRGRLGAFQKNTLDTTANALKIAQENTTAAESIIRDADFALETSNLTRSQILVQSATNVLRLSNAQPQNVLALLG